MSGPRTSLTDLIDQALVKHDTTSINALAKIGRQANYSITQTTLSQIYNGKYRSQPKAPTLDAIAWLAGVSIETAYRAAAMEAPGIPFEPAPGADRLTPKQRDVVNSVIRALLDAQLSHSSNTNGAAEQLDGTAYLTEGDMIAPDGLTDTEQSH